MDNNTDDIMTNTTRLYEIWKGKNKFCLGGRLIFGPDVRILVLTILLLTLPTAIFCLLSLEHNRSNNLHSITTFEICVMGFAIFLTVIVLILAFTTAASDPGILRRNSRSPIPGDYSESVANNAQGDKRKSRTRMPPRKKVIVNGVELKVRYCETCMFYRPPRCSHCFTCNNCVEQFDHHCPWIGQCIGRRNYRCFFLFVSSASVLCIYILAFSLVYMNKVIKQNGINIWKAITETPELAALILYAFSSLWFVGGLTVFHLYLIAINQTTYERCRRIYAGKMNPHNQGVVGNFKEIFFTKITPSQNNFRAKVYSNNGDGAFSADAFLPTPTKESDDLELGQKPESRPVLHKASH